MAVLLSGTKLRNRLTELARQSDRIDIAVAWATAWDGLSEVLSVANSHGNSAVKILVGVSGHITSPKALRQIDESATLCVYDAVDQLLFHPKLYIFHTPQGRICWVGSANLTWAAFGRNIEIVAEIADSDGSILEQFNELWACGQESGNAFDFDKYSISWREAFKTRPSFLKEEMDASEDSKILRSSWSEYVTKLRGTKNVERLIRTLDAGYELVRGEWEQPLSDTQKEIVFGLGSFTAFGDLQTALIKGKRLIVDDSSNARENRRKISEALALVIRLKQFQAPIIERTVENLVAIDGCGLALASRLLIFARPDWFVVQNKKSYEWLIEEFKFEARSADPIKQYVQLIEAIQQRDWWKSSPPSISEDRKLWGYRAAMTDALAYADYTKKKIGA